MVLRLWLLRYLQLWYVVTSLEMWEFQIDFSFEIVNEKQTEIIKYSQHVSHRPQCSHAVVSSYCFTLKPHSYVSASVPYVVAGVWACEGKCFWFIGYCQLFGISGDCVLRGWLFPCCPVSSCVRSPHQPAQSKWQQLKSWIYLLQNACYFPDTICSQSVWKAWPDLAKNEILPAWMFSTLLFS